MTDVVAHLKTHESKLLAYIHRRCRDASFAEDVMQETLLRVMEQSRKTQIDQPLAYAYRVADSVIFAHARKKKLETEIGDSDFESTAPLADETLDYKQRTVLFEKALAALTPMRRAVFTKRYLEGKSRQEIATEMGLSLEAVKKNLVRAMADLAAITARNMGGNGGPNKTGAAQ